MPPPAASRLTVRARKNRRKPAALWSRIPGPAVVANACGRALRRGVPAVVATVAVAAVGGGLWGGYRFVTTSERYAITAIEIRGTRQLSADELRAQLPVQLGANVFTADLDAVDALVRAQPWVDGVDVFRVLPDTLVVEITEHRAAAVALLGEPYLVDRAGRVFKRARLAAGDGDELPVITGLDRAAYQRDPAGTATAIHGALGALDRWRSVPTRPAIGEIHLDTRGAVTLRTFDRGASIELGPVSDLAEPLATRLRTFDAAWAELGELERVRARAIHLDARADHVIVAFAKD